MKIRHRLIIAFIIISLLVGLVGIIGLYANNRIVNSYEIGEEHFGSIIEASNEVSSYAKRAEGHTFLYLTLHNESDRKKLFQRIASLREQIAIIEGKIKNPDAIRILNDTRTKTDMLQSVIDSLVKLHDDEIKTTGEFDLKNHEELIRKLDDVSAAIRQNGLELGRIEINLQNEHNLQAKQGASSLYNIIFIISGIAIFFALIIGIIIDKNITNPINKLRDMAAKIGKGNLDMKIDIESKDEIGELSNEFNIMIEKLKKANEEIISSKEYTDNIVGSMDDSLIVVSPDGIIQKINKTTSTLLDYGEEELIGQPISKVLIDGDKLLPNILKCDIDKKKDCIKSVESKCLKKSLIGIDIIFSASKMCDNNGNLRGIVCVAHDITERKQAEKLIQDSLHEKETLLREIHHRVKNNMQMISSLLLLQSENIIDQKYIDIFHDINNRILSMALIHEKLYQSEKFTQINIQEYINDLVSNLMASYGQKGNAELEIDVDNIPLNINYAVPCGLILNELITNSLKYAFPEYRRGIIKIVFQKRDNNMIHFSVSDDGIGLPGDMDIRNTKSLGLHLIYALAENQLHGEIILNRERGTEFQINFKGE